MSAVDILHAVHAYQDARYARLQAEQRLEDHQTAGTLAAAIDARSAEAEAAKRLEAVDGD